MRAMPDFAIRKCHFVPQSPLQLAPLEFLISSGRFMGLSGRAAVPVHSKTGEEKPTSPFRYHDVEGNHVLHHCVLRKAAADVQSLMNYITISKFERVEICNSVNAQGQTALHIAVLNGDSTMVQMLLKFGVNPLVRDNNGYTCIHNACRHRDYQSMVDIVNILLSWNPQLASVTSENGRTPLMLAVQECNTVLTRTILSHLVAFTKYTPLLSDEATTPRQGTPSF